jgi:hypothetical protein
MIEFAVGKDFLVAIQRQYRKDEPIEWNGIKGIVVEAISHQDYLEVWAFRGFPTEGVSAIRPKFYYRCIRTGSDVGLETANDPQPAMRGDQESAS